jgi:hypothetical protein
VGLVNPPEVTPSVMRAICRYFSYRGKDSQIMRTELRALLEPRSIVKGDKGEERVSAVDATLTEAVALGVLTGHGDGDDAVLTCSLPLPKAGLQSTEHDAELVRALRRRLLSEENTENLFSSDRRALDTTRSREFSRIGSWLLLQNPYGPGLNYGAASVEENVERRQDEQCNVAMVVNDLRWVSFRRWARYLGLARMGTNNRLLPDPTPAIRDELESVFGDDPELPTDEFVRRLGATLPLIDEGRCQQEVLHHAFKGDPLRDLPGDHPLSSALAFALKRLERGGVIKLADRADARSYRNVAGAVVTHIEYVAR